MVLDGPSNVAKSPLLTSIMSTNPPAIPIPPNIASLTAPLLLGELFSIYLFGVLSVQVYIYHLNFPEDANYIKAFVYTVFSMEFASSLMSIYDMYHWFAKGFGSILALGDVQLSTVDTPMMGAFVAAAVQMFYCYRIYTINKKAWWISVVVALLALTEVVSGLYGGIVGERAATFLRAESKTKVPVYVLFISSVVADILIATTMIALLLLSRSNKRVQSASPQSSTSKIKKIMNLIVETNLASASTALLTLILLVTIPGTNYFTCPSYVVAKIYSNSLLLILNNRYYLAIGTGPGSSSGLFKMSRSHNKSTSDFPINVLHSREPARIDVDTTTETLHGSFNYRKLEA